MGKRILVVDDDKRVLFVFYQALSKPDRGYEIETAQSGSEALEKAKARPFDLLITDLQMPGVDGPALTGAVKAHSPRTVVVWMTTYGCRGAVARQAKRLQVHRCLDKPVEVSEIRRVAEEALAQS